MECTRVILCSVAICDVQTNMVTYVLVHETWTFPAAAFGENFPVQAHFALRGHGQFEIRPAWVDANGEVYPAGDVTDTITLDGTSRFMAPQVRVPPRAGNYDLVLEWRPQGSEGRWSRSAACSPVLLREADLPKAKA